MISRRSLLLASLVIPSVLVAGRVTAAVSEAASGAIRAVRPAPTGTSTTRCAQCGAAGHTMLDARCPMAPKVLG